MSEIHVEPSVLSDLGSDLALSVAPLRDASDDVGRAGSLADPDVSAGLDNLVFAWNTALAALADDVDFVANHVTLAAESFARTDENLASDGPR